MNNAYNAWNANSVDEFRSEVDAIYDEIADVEIQLEDKKTPFGQLGRLRQKLRYLEDKAAQMEEEYAQYEEDTDIRRQRRKDLVNRYLSMGGRDVKENPERVFREKQQFLSTIPEREKKYMLKEADSIMMKKKRAIADIRSDFKNVIAKIPSSTYPQVRAMLISLDQSMNRYVIGLIFENGIEQDFVGYANSILDAINNHPNLQFNINLGEKFADIAKPLNEIYEKLGMAEAYLPEQEIIMDISGDEELARQLQRQLNM